MVQYIAKWANYNAWFQNQTSRFTQDDEFRQALTASLRSLFSWPQFLYILAHIL